MSRPLEFLPHKSLPQPSELVERHSDLLPSDMLESARRRLLALSLFLLGLACVRLIADTIMLSTVMEAMYPKLPYGVVFLISSTAMHLVARSQRVSTRRVLQLGLVYEVVVCLVASLAVSTLVYDRYGHLPMLWPGGLVIVAFSLLIPSCPGQTILSASAAGAMAPVSVFLLEIHGRVDAELVDYAAATGNSMFAVLLAIFGAYLLYGVSVDAAMARTLGSYRLESRLGRGGMGEVWRADHHLLARPAAVKLMRPNLQGSAADRRLMRRFLREAQVTASLSSPHTVRLFDFGTTGDGAYYYVMEMLEGLDLEHLVKRYGPVSPARAVYILSQICDALAEAHASGLIHRDIKPGNVVLCRQGMQYDFAKVLDFGLVALMSESQSDESRLTIDGFVGTPDYTAPEVAKGVDEDIDHRVDIYALGCVGYWLLTGQPVFAKRSAMAAIVAHASEEPRPPSDFAESDIPAELDELLLSCLAKRPQDRPGNAEELMRALAQIPLAQPWTLTNARNWWADVPLDIQNVSSGKSEEITFSRASTLAPADKVA